MSSQLVITLVEVKLVNLKLVNLLQLEIILDMNMLRVRYGLSVSIHLNILAGSSLDLIEPTENCHYS